MRIVDWSSFVFFFFFKQKTAYELRISDWSSDVCCSDLEIEEEDQQQQRHVADELDVAPHQGLQRLVGGAVDVSAGEADHGADHQRDRREQQPEAERLQDDVELTPDDGKRSEEHTSELQSLMRISYAVFCLIQKSIQTHINLNSL